MLFSSALLLRHLLNDLINCITNILFSKQLFKTTLIGVLFLNSYFLLLFTRCFLYLQILTYFFIFDNLLIHLFVFIFLKLKLLLLLLNFISLFIFIFSYTLFNILFLLINRAKLRFHHIFLKFLSSL